MSDRPNARELAAAVHDFLEREILPMLDDQRMRFRTLVAMNALSIVERETPLPTTPDEEDVELARRSAPATSAPAISSSSSQA